MSQTTALLVIDVQRVLLEDAYQKQEVLERISGLLQQARANDTPVIYLQHEEPEYPPLNYGAPTWEIHPAVAPLEGELVLRKLASDSFYRTPLHQELQARGVSHVVVTGLMTEACIDATSRRALSMDYEVTLVADAHTTCDAELPAAQIIAHHNHALGTLAHPERSINVQPAAEIQF